MPAMQWASAQGRAAWPWANGMFGASHAGMSHVCVHAYLPMLCKQGLRPHGHRRCISQVVQRCAASTVGRCDFLPRGMGGSKGCKEVQRGGAQGGGALALCAHKNSP